MPDKMINQVFIMDAHGPQFYTRADFPLALGSRPDTTATILSLRAHRVYVEPEERTDNIRVNHRPVLKQMEIRHDDRLQIGDCTFHIEHIGDTFSLSLYDDPLHLAGQEPGIVPHGERIEPVAVPVTAKKQSGKRRPRLFALAGVLVFSALVLVLIHVFTAKSLLIEIDPAPDRMTLHGKIWPLRVQGRYLVRPGNYVLEANKSGYSSLKREIRVTAQPSQAQAFTLVKKPGYLSVTSVPEKGVALSIDGQAYGDTPVEKLELTPGTYVLRAIADWYQPYSRQLVIEGEQKPQDLHIRLQPNWAEVSIDSRPRDAEVWLNGIQYGITPLTLGLLAGEYRLELRHPDYMTHTTDFQAVANEPLALPPAQLFGSESHLVITSTPSRASVFIAGEEQGSTPLTVKLSPNTEHSITLAKPGFRSSQQTVLMKPGEQQTLAATLEAIPGTVIVTVDPEDSEVFVQDRLAGKGLVKLTLPSTAHRLEVRKSGFEVHQQTITPAPGAPQVIHVVLNRITRAAEPHSPARIHTRQGQALVLVTGGTFSMGSARREQGRRTNETLHTVALQRPFYIATTEVTNARFAAFMPAHHSGTYKGHDLSAPDLPVVNVRWADAARYCNWLSEKEGLEGVYREQGGVWVAKNPLPSGYRLPTESEWEWVARSRGGGVLQKYGWGADFPPVQVTGNYADRSAAGLLGTTLRNYEDSFATAAPVASFKANPFGIFDLGGNVAEWCHDYHSLYPALSEEVFVDPAGPASGSKHVIRGASWMRSDLSNTRLSYRDQDNTKRVDVGFRIARYPD